MAATRRDDTAELKNMLRDGKSDGVFVFYGEEEYTKQYYSELLEKTHTYSDDGVFARTVFDDLSFKIDEFTDELQNLSFGAQRKFIILRNIDTDQLEEGDRKALFSAVDGLEDGICILFYYDAMFLTEGEYDRQKRRKKMIDTLCRHGFGAEFKKLSSGELARWVTKGFSSYGINIPPDAVKYLLSVCGSDMFNLKNEIGKIAMYSRGEEITKATVDKLVTKSLEHNVFSVAQDIVEGRLASALRTVELCRATKEKPTALLRIISTTFTELMTVAAAKENNLSQEQTTKLLALPSNRTWLMRDYQRMCASKSVDFFVKANLALAECEEKLKGSGCEPWQTIEIALIKASGLK